jgi:hypothetical protein
MLGAAIEAVLPIGTTGAVFPCKEGKRIMKTLLRPMAVVLAILLPVFALLLGCSSEETAPPTQQQQATLAAIAVTPKGATVTKGATVQFAAMGTYSDATTQDLTASVTWASSDPAIALLSNDTATKGRATVTRSPSA